MERVCPISQDSFKISERDLEFYRTFGVSEPTLSPTERLRRRMTYRNFSQLYRRKCDASGKSIISKYNNSVPFPVYSSDEWWSDNWDAKAFGQNFDFNRSFFEQYKELAGKVPRQSLFNWQSDNCDYSNYCFQSKNCYLVFGCVENEDCQYGHIVWRSKNCIDCLYVYECEWCSHSIDIVGCYDVHYSGETVNCQESYFLHDCRNCQNCFGCFNLRNKQYYFFNQRLSKEDYYKKLAEYLPLSWEKSLELNSWLEKVKQEKALFPPQFNSHVEDVSGNHLYFSKNTEHCFDVKRSEDCKYCFTTFENISAYDICFGSGSFSLEGLAVMNSERTAFCNTIGNCSDLMYSEYCFSSQNLFGCCGLRNSKYCILNKQYSKDEYHALRTKITEHMKQTGEWGEFFPAKDSPFAYNESVAQQYLPLDKKEVLTRGLHWDNTIEPNTNGRFTNQLPNSTPTRSEEVLRTNFTCELSGKEYRISKPEFEFCKRMQIPLPRICPNLRHLRRMTKRSPRTLINRQCNCGAVFQTPFSTKEAKNVVCEECYHSTLG